MPARRSFPPQDSDAHAHASRISHLRCSVLPFPIADYNSENDTLVGTKNGWQTARMHANSMSTMMQAQHGCGLYCTDPIALGVGYTTLMWNSATTTQNEPTILGATAIPNRTAVIYVQVS
jgi:hypothetical protein